MKKISGIYEIKNLLNNHRYIGSSSNISHRWHLHLHHLNSNKHHSPYLQRSWNKYGKNHFIFNILEICESIKETLILLEQKYIDDLKPEYNILPNAGSSIGCKRSKSFKTNLSKIWAKNINAFNRRISIIMLDKNTLAILKEFNSITEAAEFLGNKNKKANIGMALRGCRKKASGYRWKYKDK